MRPPTFGARAAGNGDRGAWSLPPALDQPVPRQVRASGMFKLLVGTMFAPLVVSLLLIVGITLGDAHDLEVVRSVLAMTFAMTIIPTCIVVAMFLRIYYREKHLIRWGSVAAATILDETNGPRSSLRIHYCFNDANDRTVKGVRKTDNRPQFQRSRARLLDNPTVLYDPQNTTRNMLYPAGFVICSAPGSPRS